MSHRRLTEQLSALTIRKIILSLNEDQRCIILADELAMARADPARLESDSEKPYVVGRNVLVLTGLS